MLLQQKTKPKACPDSKESPGYHSMLKGQTDLRPEDEISGSEIILKRYMLSSNYLTALVI